MTSHRKTRANQTMRGRVAASVLVGTLGLSVAGPAFAAGPGPLPAIDASLAVDGPAVAPTGHDLLAQWVAAGSLGDALVIVTPGTDDGGLYPRVDDIVRGRHAKVVQYPESLGPFVSGKSGHLLPIFAPGYDASRKVAQDKNLALMRLLANADRTIVYTGFSQGADALGNAAERAAAEGLLHPGTLIVLVSDPRGPWGLKSALSRTPGAGPIMGVLGASDDGVRDPADTGDAKVVQVIVQGDPVAHTQWNPARPLSSLLVNAVGFVTIHASTGKYSYADLGSLEKRPTLYSSAGNTVYEVYDTYHPLALLNLRVAEALGIRVDKRTLERWDRQAEAFYPTQEITPATADPRVGVSTTPTHPGQTRPAGKHRLLDRDGDWAEPDPTFTTGAAPAHAAAEAGDDRRGADETTGASGATGTSGTVAGRSAGETEPSGAAPARTTSDLAGGPGDSAAGDTSDGATGGDPADGGTADGDDAGSGAGEGDSPAGSGSDETEPAAA